MLRDDPDVERWSTYVGRGAIRFYLPLSVELPNDFFSQFVVVAKDVAARERLRAKLERVLQDDFPGAVSRIVAAGARAAGGMAGAIPRQRADRDRGARHRLSAGADRCRGRAGPGGSISTGSSRAGRFACASTRIRRGCWA